MDRHDWALPSTHTRQPDPDWANARVIELAPGPLAEWDAPRYAEPGEFDPETCFYVGDRGGTSYFARMVSGGRELRLRVGEIPPAEVGVVFAAAALVNWHAAAGFCPACGGLTAAAHLGASRECLQCERELFPRTDPAVIVRVTDGADRILLGRQPSWEPGRMSVFAGFVEAGESLEQAVHRELLEEVGLSVGQVSYFGSQPWPFPRSIMLAFTTRAETTDVSTDDEIEAARWFTREELAAALAAGEVHLPSVHSIARRMIDAWM
ncbi:MAG: NAD(+) diphosphatase [Propionibacteriaceae bacterium]|jgi:NAD+ diphosphatase|nr:NAD(+) diphosphatase [Propionibacteriaceae bacterium]